MSDFAEKHLKKKSWLSRGLFGFSLLYQAITAIKRAKASPKKIGGVKIVGVGNIVCGGSGKTPFDVSLARFFLSKGMKVAISVRGYKSQLESGVSLISDRQRIFSIAKKAGDEPQLLAEKLPGVPVVVGKNRLLAVRCLQQKFPDLDVIILEDSFQNFAVAHDFDFVLFKAKVGLGNGWCLPAGYLREGKRALAAADCVVVDGENLQVETLAKKCGKQLLQGEIAAVGFFDADGKKVSLQKLTSGKCYAVSAIADPLAFEKSLEKAGVVLAEKFAFSDHCDFSDLPLEKLSSADFLLVTDKDLVKLRENAAVRERLVSLRIDYKVDFEAVRGLL